MPIPLSTQLFCARMRFDRTRVFSWAQTIGIVVLLAAIFATPGFLAGPSILSLLTTVSFIGCVAVGMTLITISGNIMSFALGATVGVTAMVFILASNWLGFGLGLVVGLLFGSLLTGLQGLDDRLGPRQSNHRQYRCSGAHLRRHPGVRREGHDLRRSRHRPGVGQGQDRRRPDRVHRVRALCTIAQFILSSTRFGRNLFMVGSSFRAAEAVGVNTWRTITGAYLWAGLFTSLAGIMLAVRYDSANMDYGVAYDYDAIAAVLVGGTAIGGGHGSARAHVRGCDGHRRGAGHVAAQGIAAGVAISGGGTDRSRGHHPPGARERAMKLWRHLDGPHARPFAVLAACIIVLTAVDGGNGQFLSAATAYSTLQTFATISLVTLGLGLTMMIREFDLSVVGMYGMAGCIAVLTGTHYPWLGLWLALAIGLTAGIVQGLHHRTPAPVVGRSDAGRALGIRRHRIRADREPLPALRQSRRRAAA